MLRSSKISSLISQILKEDDRSEMIVFRRNGVKYFVNARLTSAVAKNTLMHDVKYPLISNTRSEVMSSDCRTMEARYFLEWEVVDAEREVTPFTFDGRGDAKRKMRMSSRQEEAASEMISGRRHAGSGSIAGYKSDASSDTWQVEAKYTVNRSMTLKLDWICKISKEAHRQDKTPMMFISFNVPDSESVESDWVLIPKSVFEKIGL